MNYDMDTWLIDVGDEVIRKKASIGIDGLPQIERVIYCMWVVDYAVRNSGTLQPMMELYPSALVNLQAFATINGFSELSALSNSAADDEAFCAKYYLHFEAASQELRSAVNSLT